MVENDVGNARQPATTRKRNVWPSGDEHRMSRCRVDVWDPLYDTFNGLASDCVASLEAGTGTTAAAAAAAVEAAGPSLLLLLLLLWKRLSRLCP